MKNEKKKLNKNKVEDKKLNMNKKDLLHIVKKTSFNEKTFLSEYCDIKKVLNNHVFETKEGCLISLFNIDTNLQSTHIEHLENIWTGIGDALSFLFENNEAIVQVWFEKESRKNSYDSNLNQLKKNLKTGLNINDILDEKNKFLSELSQENHFLVFLTKKSGTLETHQENIKKMTNNLDSVGIRINLLNIIESVRLIKQSIGFANPLSTENFCDFTSKNMDLKLMSGTIQEIERNMLQVEDRIYSSVFIKNFGTKKDFDSLFNALKNKPIDWRVSFIISGTNNYPRKNNLNENPIKFQTSLSTWVNKKTPDYKIDLAKNLLNLKEAVTTWGGKLVESSDALETFLSSALAINIRDMKIKEIDALQNIVQLLPLQRKNNIFKTGFSIFKTQTGEAFLYQPISSVQTTWINLFYGRPGSGKSMLLNNLSLSACMDINNTELPQMARIDIGPSSKGLISLLKNGLPDDKKESVVYHKPIPGIGGFSNPFDTPLGSRQPSNLQKALLANLLGLIATDKNSFFPYTGMNALISDVIDKTYEDKSDKFHPNLYHSGRDLKIDEAINASAMAIDEKTTWWEIVDWLFENGYINEATLAQRHAVPLLADTATSAKSERIKTIYNINITTGENITDVFVRAISETLESYPCLCTHTQLDFNDKSVVVIDIEDCTSNGGKNTAIAYLLARNMAVRNFYFYRNSSSILSSYYPNVILQNKYENYYRNQYKKYSECYTSIGYDEFHRVDQYSSIRDQILLDMREGRKWVIEVNLASQSLNTFDETMVDFASGLFILDGGSEKHANAVVKTFRLDENDKQNLLFKVKGPCRDGAIFFAKFATTSGQKTELLQTQYGTRELWAFSTTLSDVYVRDILYQKLSPEKARHILAKEYPDGTVKGEIEKRKTLLGLENDNIHINIEDVLIAEMIKKYE